MNEKLTSNLALKIVSLLGAILLWIVVVNVDDPVKTETYSGIRVSMVNEASITSKGKVYKIEDDTDLISLSVSAKRSVHKKLTSADFVATADMEKDIQYGNLVAINVTCNNRNVSPSDIKKSWNNVKISVEDSATEDFTVVVKQKGTPGSGYIVGEMVPEQRVVSITGPASLISKIKHIEADVDVTGRTTDDTLVCLLRVLNSDGDSLDTTYLDFNGKDGGMSVKLRMLKTKTVPIYFGVTGTPAEGYEYTGMSYKPDSIDIAGTSDDLAEISVIKIPDSAVSVEGLSQTTQIEVQIAGYLPKGIRLVDATVDGIGIVTVDIEALTTRTFEIDIAEIALKGIPSGYSVLFQEESAIVAVMALKEHFAELSVQDIQIVADCSELTAAGNYRVKAVVRVPEQFRASDITIPIRLIKGNAGAGNTEGLIEPPETESETTDVPTEEGTENAEEAIPEENTENAAGNAA